MTSLNKSPLRFLAQLIFASFALILPVLCMQCSLSTQPLHLIRSRSVIESRILKVTSIGPVVADSDLPLEQNARIAFTGKGTCKWQDSFSEVSGEVCMGSTKILQRVYPNSKNMLDMYGSVLVIKKKRSKIPYSKFESKISKLRPR